jgi:hypothetical protein
LGKYKFEFRELQKSAGLTGVRFVARKLAAGIHVFEALHEPSVFLDGGRRTDISLQPLAEEDIQGSFLFGRARPGTLDEILVRAEGNILHAIL